MNPFPTVKSIIVYVSVIVGLIVLCALCGVAAKAVDLGGFWADTQINNKIVQPIVRSKLDADANYRRSIESQAQGLLAQYTSAKATYQHDAAALAAYETRNPAPWGFYQQQTYANLSAAVQGDVGGISTVAAEYNSLLNNPDNAGLLTYDPSLPTSLDPTLPTPVPTAP